MNESAQHTKAYKDAVIQNIARATLGIQTLRERGRDGLDFHELGVCQIREALAAAFEAGRQTSR